MEGHFLLPTRKRMRLKGYDYRTHGAYFITICIEGKRCVLGRVIPPDHHGSLVGQGLAPAAPEPMCMLSSVGRIVQEEILRIPSYRPSLRLDSFIVMPDHVHLLLWILSCDADGDALGLSSVVGRFKSFSTRRGNEACGTPGRKLWQSGFYDHIIRDADDLEGRRLYIERNPFRWVERRS